MRKPRSRAYELYHESIDDGAYERGIQSLSALIADGQAVGTVLQLRSHLHQLSGDDANAMRDLDEVISAGLDTGGTSYYQRGCLHHRAKDYRSALADFSEAVLIAHATGDDSLIDAAEHYVIEMFEEMRGDGSADDQRGPGRGKRSPGGVAPDP